MPNRTRQSVVLRMLLVLALLPASRSELEAQQWNEPRIDSLVDAAVARRQQVDGVLRAWTARASGTLEFLVELGDGAVLPPRVVKVEQLASLLRWQSPGNTEQRIVGRRDTMLFPGDVGFYSDRYGVVTNNLGDRIRLGDGNDVRDLAHPLSASGRPAYEFALADSLTLSLPGRKVEVYELLLRPREADAPGMAGSLYLDRATGDLVRLAVTFSRAAILDTRIERLSLILENLLVEGTWWLPYQQRLEVVRASTWFDFPTRGIVRGRWEVSDHAVVADPAAALPPPLPTTGRVLVSLPGQRIGLAPPREREAYQWPGPIAGAISPEGELTPADVANVQRRAESIVSGKALDRLQRASIGGKGISSFFHINRVEGVALGLAGTLGITPSTSLAGQVGYGFSDDVVKGRLEFRWRATSALTFGVYGERSYRDAGDVQETSGLRNTISAQLAGDDNTDPYDVQGGGAWARVLLDPLSSLTGTLSRERQRAVEVNAEPWSGFYGATIPALATDATRFGLRYVRALGPAAWGTTAMWELDGRAENLEPLDGSNNNVVTRLAGALVVRVPAGGTTLHLETHAGIAGGDAVPSQELVRLGGIISGPGFSYHQFVGKEALSQRVEWRVPVPFISIPLLGYGRSPARATLAPYGHLACVGDREGGEPGCFPSLGLGFSAIYDLVRFDVAYGFREGGWKFGVDAGRALWGIL